MASLKYTADELEKIKDKIRDSYLYFKPNYERFNWFIKFVFETSLSSADIQSLQSRGMPQLEFNILEAPISKLRTEFARQEPTLTIHAVENSENIDPKMINTLEGYIRARLADCNQDNLQYDIFTDQLAGGFSVIKVATEYVHERSFNQDIYIRRAYDPTLCVFDKKAIKSHKGDGSFCAELYPKMREDIEELYGKKATEGIKISNSLMDFSWSYRTNKSEDIFLVADYYQKKIKKEKIVQLVTGEVIEEKIYDKFVEWWNQHTFIQAPGVIGKARVTEIPYICHYVLIQDKILDYEETDYKYLPLIYVDGNSIRTRDNSGDCREISRPYVYHAAGIQRLKNYAGMTLANDFENMVQHKFLIPFEGLHDAYLEWIKDPQKPSTGIYRAFKEDDPTVPVPPPIPVQRVPLPPEVAATFTVSDEITRAILGNYDAILNNPQNNLSGEAIAQGAIQSQGSAGPYLVNYIKALNRVGEIMLDLIPKYITQPRSIPWQGLNNKREYHEVNSQNSSSMDYEPNHLQVRIEAGVNFEIQRARSLAMLNQLMGTMPVINEYISTEVSGIEMLLDNIDIRGIDSLKQNIAQFVNQKKQQIQQQQQMQQQQAQMQMQMMQQNSPAAIKQAELQQKGEQMMLDHQAKQRELDIRQQLADIQTLATTEDISLKEEQLEVRKEEAHAQNLRSEVDLAIKKGNTKHLHALDLLKIHHSMKGL